TINLSGVVRANSVSQAGGIIRLSGSGKVTVEQTALVDASGTGGGNIQIEAGSFSTEGHIRAEGSSKAGGAITIVAETVALGGTLSVDGVSGGSVEVQAATRLSLADTVSAVGRAGAGGKVSYRAGADLVETSTGNTTVSGITNGGYI